MLKWALKYVQTIFGHERFLHVALMRSYSCLHFSNLCLNSTLQQIISSIFLRFSFEVPFPDFSGLRILLVYIKRKVISWKAYLCPSPQELYFCLLLHTLFLEREKGGCENLKPLSCLSRGAGFLFCRAETWPSIYVSQRLQRTLDQSLILYIQTMLDTSALLRGCSPSRNLLRVASCWSH